MQLETSQGYSEAPRGVREWIFIFVLCATQLFTQGALGYIIIPLSEIRKTFNQSGHEHAARMAWHVAGYSLTVGSFILVAGRLGNIYNPRRILIIGWLWFGVWSIIAGSSAWTGSAVFFDVSRAFQGIGPALLMPNALAIAGRTYPPGTKKNIIFSMFALSAPLGCALGGLIGAPFAQYVWWPWAALLSGIACFLVALTAYLVVPQQQTVMPDGQRMRFDWIGAILGVGGLLLLNVSWNQAPIDGWSTPYVYVILILGFLFLGLFVWQEKRAVLPIMDVTIINRRVAGVLCATGLGWASFGIWFYYLFLFLHNLRGVSSLGLALQFLPGALSGMIAPIVTARLLSKISTSWLMVLASVAFTAGCLLEALAPVEQSYWFNVFWSFVVMPWGMDVSFPASTLFISDSVPIEHQGISASLVSTVVNYSIAIGLGITGTVEVYLLSVTSVLEGYRAAQWTSVGLAGMGLASSILLVALDKHKEEKTEC